VLPILEQTGIKIEENFADTSPGNGALSFKPYKKRIYDSKGKNPLNTAGAEYGDAHFYYQAADCENQTTFEDWRFLSESGFQSEPTFQEYKQVSTA
jgi:hypothetical protein